MTLGFPLLREEPAHFVRAATKKCRGEAALFNNDPESLDLFFHGGRT